MGMNSYQEQFNRLQEWHPEWSKKQCEDAAARLHRYLALANQVTNRIRQEKSRDTNTDR
jgi:hypothetical protein